MYKIYAQIGFSTNRLTLNKFFLNYYITIP